MIQRDYTASGLNKLVDTACTVFLCTIVSDSNYLAFEHGSSYSIITNVSKRCYYELDDDQIKCMDFHLLVETNMHPPPATGMWNFN